MREKNEQILLSVLYSLPGIKQRSVANIRVLKPVWVMNIPLTAFLLAIELTRAPLGGGGYFEPPPLVFLRYLLNRCRYHRQTCSTLSPNIFTHCVKILKSRVS